MWFVLTSSVMGFSRYRAAGFVWAFDRWNIGDPTSSAVGYTTDTTGHHYGLPVRWEFGTQMVYNGGKGAVIHELELVALTGRVALGVAPQISTSYSVDGQTWSQYRYIAAGMIGNSLKRLVWWQQGFMRNFRIQRFQGDSTAHISFMRLEAQIEPLAY